MSKAFRDLLRKVGSGTHTCENLTRAEAAAATRMMLLGEATPAQIGAFLISHRIKRPTGEELAGMLDAYDELGPKLQPISPHPVIVLGVPYDGRERTAPITPLTALLLTAAEVPVVMHGSDRMPTKYGLPLVEIWHSLGVDWTSLSLAQTQQIFEATGLGFIYLPQHFPLAQRIFEYRDQIGKRPPFATMELIWCPYAGNNAHIIAGFVHPPTENMFQTALAMRQSNHFTTIKGLEGSPDLPRDRTAIIGLSPIGTTTENIAPMERLHLLCRDYGFSSKNVSLGSTPQLIEDIHSVLQGQPSEMMQSALWNGGFYLWRSGVCPDIQSGLAKAEALFVNGQAAQKLQEIIQALASSARSLVQKV